MPDEQPEMAQAFQYLQGLQGIVAGLANARAMLETRIDQLEEKNRKLDDMVDACVFVLREACSLIDMEKENLFNEGWRDYFIAKLRLAVDEPQCKRG